MSDKETTSKEPVPYKKISNSQFLDLMESFKKRGIEISDEDKSALISDGVVVSRRCWTRPPNPQFRAFESRN